MRETVEARLHAIRGVIACGAYRVTNCLTRFQWVVGLFRRAQRQVLSWYSVPVRYLVTWPLDGEPKVIRIRLVVSTIRAPISISPIRKVTSSARANNCGTGIALRRPSISQNAATPGYFDLRSRSAHPGVPGLA